MSEQTDRRSGQDRRSTDQRMADMEASVEGLREEMPALVAEGIRQAVGDPAMWAGARHAMQEQATSAAGNVLLAGLKYIGGRLFWAAAVLLGLYMLGGMPAVLAMLKMMGHDKP